MSSTAIPEDELVNIDEFEAFTSEEGFFLDEWNIDSEIYLISFHSDFRLHLICMLGQNITESGKRGLEGEHVQSGVNAGEFQRSVSESLSIPPDDPRRNYLNKIFQWTNAGDFASLSEFLRTHSAEDFVVSVKGRNPLLSFSNAEMHLPQSISIVGVDAYLNLNSSMGDCVPDRFYQPTETIIRNSRDKTIILSKYVLTGTLVYKVNPPQKVSSSQLVVKDSSFKPNYAAGNFVSTEDDNNHSMSLEGTATLQMDKNGKIQRICFDYTNLRNKNWIKLQRKKLKAS